MHGSSAIAILAQTLSSNLFKMALVTNYSHLRKQDIGAREYRTFTALRAIGLAYELGPKAAKTKGLGSLTPGDVSCVSVSENEQIAEAPCISSKTIGHQKRGPHGSPLSNQNKSSLKYVEWILGFVQLLWLCL